MNAHSLRVLEFDAVRALLAEHAACALGRERAEALAPLTELAEVRQRQAETTEAARLLDRTGQIPLGGIRDIRASVQVASIEGMLEPSALLSVADTLAASRSLRAFLLKHEEEAPSLATVARFISEFPQIEAGVHAAIDQHGEVRDEASALLQRLRREAKVVHGRIMERLQSLLRSASHREMIQEPIITVRDDRYCIPVKSEWRSQFGGLVHDQSSSGATVFMEPTAVVELGNELRQIAIRERQEVERILRELTGRIGHAAGPINDTLAALGEIDFITARARLSQAQEAAEPLIEEAHEDAPALWLRRARHPLLKGEVVPIDVSLGERCRILVITGPNTGGKTVTLKTVGLLALMAQSGLHVPAESGSRLPVFSGIFADIGDEQSIQQSLSTFSGHITNIVTILAGVEACRRAGDGPALVLLDELGAGTDPTEGAALAKAILTHLLDRGALCIATTHYGELKEFAFTREGVENASVEFDLETLWPTYRLLTGIPGSSNAFTIAARLGLPEPVIAAARALVGTDQAQLAEVIERLTLDQRAADEHRRVARRAQEDVEALRARYERDLRQLRADREETLRRARAEAERTLRAARAQAEAVREELRRIEREARQAGESRQVARLRQDLTRATQKAVELPPEEEPETLEPLPPSPPEHVRLDARPPEPGEAVWIAVLNQRGVLLARQDGDRAQVQIGNMRTSVPYASLQRVAPLPGRREPVAAGARVARAPAGGGPAADLQLQRRANISPEIHLRGQHVEEALLALDEYMDDACLAGLSPVRVVHGKGTGALKRAVWEWLRSHPNVEDFRLGEEGEGGGGVTVVRLKE
jgi:DNA mismatch repair protein MutS2